MLMVFMLAMEAPMSEREQLLEEALRAAQYAA
jgi:hypothetical protein